MGNIGIGASIRSNKPLQPVIEMWENDYGTYDHTDMQESLLPVSEWGSEFIVPTDVTYVYIFAKDQTQVTITRPGQSSTSQTISARKNLKLSSVLAGTSISANNPVELLAVNIQTDQNYPWSYNVLPITKLGTEYYYDMSYKEIDLWPETAMLFITAVNDGTNVNVDENNDGLPEKTYNLNSKQSIAYQNPVKGAHILSNDKIYVVYNEYALHNEKWNGAATELTPVNSYGTNFAVSSFTGYLSTGGMLLSATASQDNTHINIDNNWDGTPETTATLNKGQIWYDLKSNTPSRHIWSE